MKATSATSSRRVAAMVDTMTTATTTVHTMGKQLLSSLSCLCISQLNGVCLVQIHIVSSKHLTYIHDYYNTIITLNAKHTHSHTCLKIIDSYITRVLTHTCMHTCMHMHTHTHTHTHTHARMHTHMNTLYEDSIQIRVGWYSMKWKVKSLDWMVFRVFSLLNSKTS